ncbi:MAG: ribulose-phosphate 3-epimerase [Clostridiales bacterium]|nr:ribulose-phosphate 3-epimerase [Clostridiales bacterium]
MAKIAPSILSADFARLGEDISDVQSRNIDYLHIDVMDGMLVPNISFGPAVMKSLNRIAKVPYDIHLMIERPERYINEFITENTEFITVHYEACDDLAATIALIHKLGAKAGVSIKPGTSPEVLDDFLNDIDLILVMSVEPGFGGQKFMENSIPKIQYFVDKKRMDNYQYIIEVDGGINPENAYLVKEAGVDLIVAGSAVFNAKDRTYAIEKIKE